MINAATRTNECQSLVDITGLGKPPTFTGESARFTEWLRKTTGFLIAACGSVFRPLLDWVEDQNDVISNDALEQQFGALSDEFVEDLLEQSEQVHVAHKASMEGQKLRHRSWSKSMESGGVATSDLTLGFSEWRKV